jgi:hypothetical protein
LLVYLLKVYDGILGSTTDSLASLLKLHHDDAGDEDEGAAVVAEEQRNISPSSFQHVIRKSRTFADLPETKKAKRLTAQGKSKTSIQSLPVESQSPANLRSWSISSFN